MLLAVDEDRLAVNPKEPAPLRGELDGDLERRLGAGSKLEHPAVEGEARHRKAGSLLEHCGEHPVRRQPLHIDAHRLLDDVVGEAAARARALAFKRERGAARVAQEALERLKRTAQPGRSSRGLAVALGVQARAFRAPDTAFSPRAPPFIRSFTG